MLFAAVAALLVMLAMRISGSRGTRRGLAIALIVLAALCVALPVADAARANDRFGGVEGVDGLTRMLSVQLGLSEDVVRERFATLLDQDLRVEISPGLWITAAGGVLLVAGGVLGLLWVRRDRGTRPSRSRAIPAKASRDPRTSRGCLRRPLGAPPARRR